MTQFKLTIEWTPGGRVEVSGTAVQDKGIAYAMLELAKDAVREYVAQHQSAILKPDGADLKAMPKAKHG
jgi:hypothetical protein